MVSFRKNPWKYIFSLIENRVVISRVKKNSDEHDEIKLSLLVFTGVLNGDAFRFSHFLQGRGVKLAPEEIEKFKQDPDFAICFNNPPKKEPKIKQPKQNYSDLILQGLQELREIKQIVIRILNAQNMTTPDTKKIETKAPITDNQEPKPPPEPIQGIHHQKNATEKTFIYDSQKIPPYEFCKVRNETLADNEIRIKIPDAPKGQWLAIIPYEDFEKFFIKIESKPDYKNKYLSLDKDTVIITGKSSAPILLNLDPSSLNIIQNFLDIKVKDKPAPTFILDENTTYQGNPTLVRKTQVSMSKNEIEAFTRNHRATFTINALKVWIEPNVDSRGVILFVPLNTLAAKPKEEYKGFTKRIDKTILRELTYKMSQIFRGDLIELAVTTYYFHIEDYKLYYQDKMDKRHKNKIYLFDINEENVAIMHKYFG
jgi:hypothetical protein